MTEWGISPRGNHYARHCVKLRDQVRRNITRRAESGEPVAVVMVGIALRLSSHHALAAIGEEMGVNGLTMNIT